MDGGGGGLLPERVKRGRFADAVVEGDANRHHITQQPVRVDKTDVG